jgi:uncharacterized membrane protein
MELRKQSVPKQQRACKKVLVFLLWTYVWRGLFMITIPIIHALVTAPIIFLIFAGFSALIITRNFAAALLYVFIMALLAALVVATMYGWCVYAGIPFESLRVITIDYV